MMSTRVPERGKDSKAKNVKMLFKYLPTLGSNFGT